ncbi:hypothetical protein COV82_06350, partial [Candidatus Peregrinibacteria bacterium CG11_big_fil_rev_8_21_14_0_20_46_8]
MNIFRILIFIIFVGIPLGVHAQIDGIVISEIGAFEPADTEWIEIYNSGSEDAAITELRLFENSTNHGITTYRGGAVVAPNTYAIIANKAADFVAKYPDYTGTVFDSSWGSLKEEGEELGLKNDDDSVVEQFIYPAHSGGTSLERVDLGGDGSDAHNWAGHPSGHTIGTGYIAVIAEETAEP